MLYSSVFKLYIANLFHLSFFIYLKIMANLFPNVNFTIIVITTEITKLWLHNTLSTE